MYPFLNLLLDCLTYGFFYFFLGIYFLFPRKCTWGYSQGNIHTSCLVGIDIEYSVGMNISIEMHLDFVD